MKLSDAVSALHLPIFAELPLLVFLVVFAGVAVRILSSREGFEEVSSLPLRDEQEHPQQAEQ